jgi:polysaccharide biosynthesis transport protein
MEQFAQDELSESTVDIKEYFYLFWSWAWLILLAGLVAGVTAYIISAGMVPEYEASTRLLVSAPSSISGVDPTSLVTAQTMTSTYSQMLMDRPVLEGVIDQLKLQTTPEELKKVVSVSVVTNTQLMTVTVRDMHPTQAANIANAMASVFADRIRELQSQRYAASRDGLAKQVSDMESQIAATNNLISMTSDPGTLEQLQARLTQYRTIYSNLVTSYEQVRLAEEQTSTNVVVSEPAAVPLEPVSPKIPMNTLLGVMAGMLLAGAAVFVIDALDDTIKNPDEIRRRFNLPILAMIAWHESGDNRPVALVEPRSPTAESFRSLRTNLTYAALDKPLRRILITSPMPQDGKTTVASSLAVVFSQNDKNVVLVDADLRRPQVHRRFGLHNRLGLSDMFIRPPEMLSSMVHESSTPKLAVITSGGLPPNPSELLTSKMMGQILDRLNAAFDLIVIDTPPLLTVTDAAALAPAMDGVILVAKPGSTKLGAFRQSLDQLRAVGARVLGVVLNDVKPSSRKYGYYYNRYYSKYSQYYEAGTPATKKVKTQKRPPEERATRSMIPGFTIKNPGAGSGAAGK